MKSHPEISWQLFCESTLLLSVVTLSAPTNSDTFTAKIKSEGCSSPVKDYFLKTQSLSEFCEVNDSLIPDSRSLFCHGFFDLHTSFCSTTAATNKSFEHLSATILDTNATENLSDFCRRWKNQSVRELTAELFKQHSFKVITKNCRRHCENLEDEGKLNEICPLLLRGSQILFEARKSSFERDQRKEFSYSKNSDTIVQTPPGASKKDVNLGNPEVNATKSPNTVNILPVGVSENGGELSQRKDDALESPDNLDEASQTLKDVSKTGKVEPSIRKDDVQATFQNAETFANPLESPKEKSDDLLVTAPVKGPPVDVLNPGTANSMIANDFERQNQSPLEEIEDESKVEPAGRVFPQGDGKSLLDLPVTNKENVQLEGKLKQVVETSRNDKLEDSNRSPVKSKTDIQDINYDNEDSIFQNQNTAAELMSSKQNFLPESDVFVEAEDSRFFQFFMIISAAFILGYVAIVNKKKLIALIVEGRRNGTKRRHHSASYSKLDSNLEEALSSNNTAIFSNQVLY